MRLTIEIVVLQVPLDADHQDVIAGLVPITTRARDGSTPAELGHFFQANAGIGRLWHRCSKGVPYRG
jgi:hypothetical protein